VPSFLDKAIRLNVFSASAGVAAIIVAFAGQARAATELNCFPREPLSAIIILRRGIASLKPMFAILTRGGLYFHTLANSAVIDRRSQYTMSDSSNSANSEQWTGRLNKGQNLIMVGEVKIDRRTGFYYYLEEIYDQSRGGALIVKTVAQCSPVGNGTEASILQTAVPPRADRYVPVRGSDQVVVPMVSDGGTFAVPVTINNQITLKFVVDSGASDVSIPTDVVSTLVRTGTITDADFLGRQTYRLADGSTVPSQRFQIRSLKVGNRTSENVTAGIAPVAGQLVLGQSFLKRFQSWSIDNGRSALILNGDPTPSDGSQPVEPSLSGLVASPGSE
jgi:clan AA aspartic protease (TIGR02281 family)